MYSVMDLLSISNFLDETSKQVCALKVLAIAVGKGLDNLVYFYEEYNSVS